MRYLEIASKGKLLDYKESKLYRIETWYLMLKELEYHVECYWFYSNDGEFPNTIKYKEL